MGLLDHIQGLHAGMDYHLARHNVLTANLTQVDTPGYRPLDLARVSPFQGQLRVELARTASGHLAGRAPAAPATARLIPDPTAPAGADGNAVSVDREAVKIASNQLRYDALATLVSASLSGLAWAASDGRQ